MVLVLGIAAPLGIVAPLSYDSAHALAAEREKLKAYESTAKNVEASKEAKQVKGNIALIQKRRAELEKDRRSQYAEILKRKLAADREKKIADRHSLQAELDRILQKVHDHGIHSLTSKEKKVLKQATRAQQIQNRP